MAPDRNLSPEAAGEILDLTPDTIRRYLRDGILRGFKNGNKWKVPQSAVNDYMANGGTASSER